MRGGIKPADVGVMAACILLAGGLSAAYAGGLSGAPRQVRITVDGKPYASYPFHEKISAKAVEIRTEFGYNKVEITAEGVRVTASDCPDKLEVRAGAISQAGQSLICLPNRLVVTLAGNEAVDGVAY